MSNLNDPRPPLPEWILDAFDVLTTRATDVEDCNTQTITRDDAVDVLLTADELELEPADTDYVLQRLLERGYFYEVDGELRVTPTD
ncbi:hypothetical protein OB955_14825 [Halobacteria archaeon AArc-m2/3/4]|uniref:Uncharacterized protein n=1 Tax=Natronoglomus mannanivorans TaxID=2979990 RepID=A0AAP3E3Y5_9EURY|nr:hypothetical protein [Halobacteria archaeon AArc-xg1-1]MCU4974005.1 hypothetical protein [Halobacteria archaeon AArc-m2/3/4]